MLPMAEARGFSGNARPSGPRSRLTGLPGPQHVVGRVLVAIQHQPAARADVGAHTETFAHALPPAAAILAGERGWYRDDSTASICCFAFENGPKRRPSRIRDACGETVVPDHIGHPSLALDVLVHALAQGNGLATALAALFAPRHPPLGHGKLLLGTAVVAGVRHLLPIRCDEKRLESDVNAGHVPGARQGLCRYLRTGDTRIPPVCFPTDSGGLLGSALEGPMQPDADTANLGEAEHAPIQDDPIAVFGEREAGVATCHLKAQIAGVLTRLQSAEAGSLGPFHA